MSPDTVNNKRMNKEEEAGVVGVDSGAAGGTEVDSVDADEEVGAAAAIIPTTSSFDVFDDKLELLRMVSACTMLYCLVTFAFAYQRYGELFVGDCCARAFPPQIREINVCLYRKEDKCPNPGKKNIKKRKF
jgi:hypothetical protein